MKLLFITDNFPPEVNAPATRTYEHCKEWIKDKNVEISVITCFPNFPHGKVYEGYKNQWSKKENLDGIEVIRVWSYMSPNRDFLKRVMDYFSFSLSAFRVGLFQQYDIIVATSPQFFTTWTAWALSKIKKKPWVFELRDLWPESIQTVGAIKQSFLINLLEKIELGLYKDATRVVAVTHAFRENLISRGIDGRKIDVVTNGANIDLFTNRDKDQTLLKALHLEDKFIIGYIGTHGLAHSLDFIVQSIAKVDNPSIHFLFIGDGAVKNQIMTMAEDLKLTNITFLNPIEKEEVPRYLSIIDVALAPLKKSDTFKNVIPSKIFEASAMQKPTLLGVEGEAKEMIERYHAGICFEPENEHDFLEKVALLYNDKEKYSFFQEGCIKLSLEFDRKNLAKKMLMLLRAVEEDQPSFAPYRGAYSIQSKRI